MQVKRLLLLHQSIGIKFKPTVDIPHPLPPLSLSLSLWKRILQTDKKVNFNMDIMMQELTFKIELIIFD